MDEKIQRLTQDGILLGKQLLCVCECQFVRTLILFASISVEIIKHKKRMNTNVQTNYFQVQKLNDVCMWFCDVCLWYSCFSTLLLCMITCLWLHYCEVRSVSSVLPLIVVLTVGLALSLHPSLGLCSELPLAVLEVERARGATVSYVA